MGLSFRGGQAAGGSLILLLLSGAKNAYIALNSSQLPQRLDTSMARESARIVANAVQSDDDEIGGCCPIFKGRRKAAEGPFRKSTADDSKSKEMPAKEPSGDKPTDMAGGTVEQRNSINVVTLVSVSAVGPENMNSRDADAILPLPEASGSTEKIPQTSRMREAERRLNAAVANLELIIGKGSTKHDEIDLQHISGVNDINCMAQKIGSTIANYMNERDYLKASRGPVKVFVETWFKRSIPFVKKGLNVAKVCISKELFTAN